MMNSTLKIFIKTSLQKHVAMVKTIKIMTKINMTHIKIIKLRENLNSVKIIILISKLIKRQARKAVYALTLDRLSDKIFRICINKMNKISRIN